MEQGLRRFLPRLEENIDCDVSGGKFYPVSGIQIRNIESHIVTCQSALFQIVDDCDVLESIPQPDVLC